MVADVLRCKLASDDRLGRLAATGAPGAADAVCERYREPLARYCRALVGDPEDAQEATQAALERAVRALRDGQEPRALRPWLYRIAHNAAMDVVRRRRPDATLDEVGDDLLADVRSEAVREQLAEVLHDLRDLPERQRGALLLRELAGLSYPELATAMGTSAQAARQSVFEARAGLVAAHDGRSTSCDTVRQTLDEGDRRHLRSRSMRAHLDDCGGCRDFARGIRTRRRALGLLPVPWAATLAAGAAGVGTGATAIGGWGALKATATIAAALTATAGSVATVERLAHPPRADRPAAQRADRPDPRPAATRPDTVVQAPVSATAAATPQRRATRRAPAASTPTHARVVLPAAATADGARDQRAERRAGLRDAARRKRQAEAHRQASAPTTAPAPSGPSAQDRRQQALEDARRRTQQALAEAQTQARQTFAEAQERTRQALDQARRDAQEQIEAHQQTTRQQLETVAEATRQTLDATRTAVEQSLSRFLTGADGR